MLEQIEKSKVLILGFGVEGQATLLYLSHQFPQKKFAIADQREVLISADLASKQFKKLKFFCGTDYLKNLNQYDLILKSPGIKKSLPELIEFEKTGGKITSATNLFMSQVQGKVIGITGSKGKSTVSSLVYSVLKKAKKKVNLIGNIGKPALDFLANDSAENWYVYEMSSYQLEDLEIKPQYALINNLFPEHLDYHGSLENYYEAKLNIIESCSKTPLSFSKVPLAVPCETECSGEGDTGGVKPQILDNLSLTSTQNIKVQLGEIAPATRAEKPQQLFYNASSQELSAKIQKINCDKIPFNDGVNSKIENGKLIYRGEKILDSKDVKLLGKHNLENILGVIVLAKELEIDSRVIAEAVADFRGLEHRLEYVGKFQDIHFYNDSISTTPQSTIQAIEALGKNLETLILGGLDRGYDFAELAKVILASEIKNVIFFPDTGKRIWENLQVLFLNKKPSIKPFFVENMQDCVKIAFQKTNKEKICLLSPASPSYNLFKNFKERGNLYKKNIKKYE